MFDFVQEFSGDNDQINAAKLITQKPVVVMSGRGGCGKTFVVSNVLSKALEMKKQCVLQEFAGDLDDENVSTSDDERDKASKTRQEEIEEEVLITAPTGKAASILGRRTSLPSHTLHSVIYSCTFWEQAGGQGDWKFNNVRLLVCDECSMISVRVFSKLLSCLTRWTQLQQVILLGDVDQLPSIEPGNFLSDIYTALEAHGVAIRLRTNHRTDSELIVRNAVKISNHQMPTFDPLRFLSVPYGFGGNDSDRETNTVTEVVKTVLQREELRDHRSSQFVAFRRKDCDIINELCALHYNNHSALDRHRKPDYRVGDKICIRRNVECFDVYQKKPVKLCSGEIFFITEIIQEQDNLGKKRVFFSLDNGNSIIKISFQELRAAKLAHSWARTIHTFQVKGIQHT